MICGIDEVGRGPLAGPVTAAAVVLPDSFDVSVLDDSKKLSTKKRRIACECIMDQAAGFGIGWVWPQMIDTINIHHASLLAMQFAFKELTASFPDIAVTETLVDGKFAPDLPAPARPIIKGDSWVPSIQAASIIAKEARDRWMVRYSWLEPGYGFEHHKGYPTQAHRESCMKLGLCEIHRRSFRILQS